jgi:hypothetical protein
MWRIRTGSKYRTRCTFKVDCEFVVWVERAEEERERERAVTLGERNKA